LTFPSPLALCSTKWEDKGGHFLNHDPLPLLAEASFPLSAPPHAWVTFLNRSLKRKGFTFGVSESDGRFRLMIYATGVWKDPKDESP